MRQSILQRIAEDAQGCWIWQKSVGSHGYGQLWDENTVRLAHRLSFEAWWGEIPAGLTVDHVCRVRRCCNPWHLRLKTNVDNARDNGMARKTHCPKGHPYEGENLYVNPKGHRQCRQCARDRRT